MGEVKENEATEAKEKTEEASRKLNQDELAELSPKDYQAYRKMRQKEAGAKIQKILSEYDVAIDAELVIGREKIEPRIRLIDAYPTGNNV